MMDGEEERIKRQQKGGNCKMSVLNYSVILISCINIQSLHNGNLMSLLANTQIETLV